MTDTRDLVLEEIGRALNVTASPGFEARVRTEIGRRPSGVWQSFRSWQWAATIAAVTLVALGIVFQTGSTRPAIEPAAHPALVGAMPPRALTTPPRAAATTTNRRAANGRRGRMAAAVRSNQPAASTNRGPDLTVVTTQPAVLRALWARSVPTGRRAVEVPAPEIPRPPAELRPPPPVSVAAIDVPAIPLDRVE
jgi:hypothetical protein